MTHVKIVEKTSSDGSSSQESNLTIQYLTYMDRSVSHMPPLDMPRTSEENLARLQRVEKQLGSECERPTICCVAQVQAVDRTRFLWSP